MVTDLIGKEDKRDQTKIEKLISRGRNLGFDSLVIYLTLWS
jgi:hypothetical protein